MNEQPKCQKCNDTGMEYYTWRTRTDGGFGTRHCDCPAAARIQQRMAELAQMGLQLRQRCNELNAQASQTPE